MKRNSVNYKIFQNNLTVIIVQLILVAMVFSIVIHFYMEREITSQLQSISDSAVSLTTHQRPPFFKHRPETMNRGMSGDTYYQDQLSTYIMLNRALREPLSLLNAEYILLDKDKNMLSFFSELLEEHSELSSQILKAFSGQFNDGEYIKFKLEGTNYIAVTKAIETNNTEQPGWIIVYASLQNMNHLQLVINCILFIILLISLLVTLLLCSSLSKKLTEPFAYLSDCIKAIAERDFGKHIEVPVFDELAGMVHSINTMSEKLDHYDKTQKIFLQNASHEFRTPLMSIQSYAEGIKYQVVENNAAAEIIIEESKRMAMLVEELLYLSRIDDESYDYKELNLALLVSSIVGRLIAIAKQNQIQLQQAIPDDIVIWADELKFSQAVINIISNCIRYAKTTVSIDAALVEKHSLLIRVSDDGEGFDPAEIPYVFERFYKGKNGNLGLGLAISKSVIERHNSNIRAQNGDSGGAMFTISMKLAPPSLSY